MSETISQLVGFLEARVEALHNALKNRDAKIADMDAYISTLETFIIELTDKDCPEDYKRVVFGEIMKNK